MASSRLSSCSRRHRSPEGTHGILLPLSATCSRSQPSCQPTRRLCNPRTLHPSLASSSICATSRCVRVCLHSSVSFAAELTVGWHKQVKRTGLTQL